MSFDVTLVKNLILILLHTIWLVAQIYHKPLQVPQAATSFLKKLGKSEEQWIWEKKILTNYAFSMQMSSKSGDKWKIYRKRFIKGTWAPPFCSILLRVPSMSDRRGTVRFQQNSYTDTLNILNFEFRIACWWHIQFVVWLYTLKR